MPSRLFAADRSPPATEWLVADAARSVLRLRARREVAVADLFLAHDGRLRDDDRATIAGLLSAIVEATERALRLHLAGAFADRPMLAESLASGRIPIARPILERSGSLRDPALVAALAQRAEEGRVIARLRRARDRGLELEPDPQPALLDMLTRDAAADVADAAARLAAAGRDRRDPTGAALPGAAEFPAEVQHRLVWRVAAALRDYVVASHAVEPGSVDPRVAQAAAAVLAGYDEGETLPSLAVALARALLAGGRLDDAIVVRALADGEPGLAAAALAVRAGVGVDAAWDMMIDPDVGRLLLLCRGADLAPPQAADMALRLTDEGDEDALADRIEAYGGMTPDRASAALALWRIDPVYVDAIAELARGTDR
ncbi:DUF2336 domain-containing protein [Sphingomonas profundi]|uniref:DUF2336 domain-containing protein n=1 Tax=Alterirhizorhabdus profundi TaxID=2681549 RepID=UPI0012E936C0|nr:DUF2336 domain-containing protein [Sphingomonas profundi]